MSPGTVLEVLVNALRTSGITDILWGEEHSPYYDQVPEPSPAFPYVVIELPDSEVAHTFGGDYPPQTEVLSPYLETYRPAFHVYHEEGFSVSPYLLGTVLRFLDSFRDHPEALNGTGFDVIQFTRQSWALNREPIRAPDGGRVWVANATYALMVNTR